MIYTGYIANWKNYPEDEIKIRVARPHVLAPSQLLLRYWKKGLYTWDKYTEVYIEELLSNSEAVEELSRIYELSKDNTVRLMCFEKNPPCHRWILLDLFTFMKTGGYCWIYLLS